MEPNRRLKPKWQTVRRPELLSAAEAIYEIFTALKRVVCSNDRASIDSCNPGFSIRDLRLRVSGSYGAFSGDPRSRFP